LCALYNVGTHTLYNGKFNNDEKTIQALLENENSPKKWAVIDSFLTENKFYKSKQLGIFLFYNKNLDYPADLSNFFVLSKEQQFALSPTNKGPLEQEYLNSKNETKDFVLRNFIIKNDISFILSRNKSANGILKNYSVDQGLFSLKYSSGGLELWKVNKVN
jgi:hypothetical protein